MSASERMSAGELRAAIGLAGIFGLRMLGLFAILPVFSLYAVTLAGGSDLTLVGIALGAYGLTQAMLQIPFGVWSDRIGRKPVMYIGLALFALGSVVAGCATSIHGVIVGRVLQGAGAISAVAIAMAADSSREQHRTKVMAIIGSTIGVSFAISLVVGPWISRAVGVQGIFFLIGVLALVAMGVVAWLPNPRNTSAGEQHDAIGIRELLRARELGRLNLGIFVLHATLVSLFVAVPHELIAAGIESGNHWKIYAAVMLGATVLMAPAVYRGDRRAVSKPMFLVSIAMVAIGYGLLVPLRTSSVGLTFALLTFFTGFMVLEAMLPSQVARVAPAGRRGTAIAIYSTVQFLGAFCGGALGGALMQHFGLGILVLTNLVLVGVWFALAVNMQSMQADSTGGMI